MGDDCKVRVVLPDYAVRVIVCLPPPPAPEPEPPEETADPDDSFIAFL
jgi:hypothetical protein